MLSEQFKATVDSDGVWRNGEITSQSIGSRGRHCALPVERGSRAQTQHGGGKVNVKGILSQYELYQESDLELREELERHTVVTRYGRGDFVSKQGEQCTHVLFLGSGEIRAFLVGPNGREVTLYRLSPGQLCVGNVLTAMNGGIAAVNTRTTGPVTAATMPAAVFKKLLATSPALREGLFKSMSERMEVLLTLIEGITFQRMESRIAEYLIERSEADDNGDTVLTSTHADIAADLGSAREVVSRVLKVFKNRGAVDVGRKQIKLRELDLLHEIRTSA